MPSIQTLYDRLPGGLQYIAKHGFLAVHELYDRLPEGTKYLLASVHVVANPNVSLREWNGNEAPAAFVDQFFDDRDEYESYAAEFWNSEITDICYEAEDAVSDDATIFDAHRDECERLYAVIRKLEPETVVETGVYHGVSTASILLALDANGEGTLYSIDAVSGASAGARDGSAADGDDIDEFFERGRPSCSEPGTHTLPPGREPGWIIPTDLRRRWELNVGKSRRELPGLLSRLGGVDVFLHDSDHSTSGMLFEFELAWEWLRPGGAILSHHVDWNWAFETFVEERPCEHGPMSYTYYGDFSVPCRSGYAVKPTARSADTDTTTPVQPIGE